MKKVLVALDYGPTAQQVAEAGYALAQAMIAEVVLLHVTAEPAYYSSTAYSPMIGFICYGDIDLMQPETLENIKRTSLEFLEKSKAHLGDDSIQVVVKEGDSAEAIMDAAKETGSDIIVLGSHSRKWLEAIVMGSVTEKVLRHTTIPLFIVPTKK
jgi:nucleotide-binding universal stress UspA family protein